MVTYNFIMSLKITDTTIYDKLVNMGPYLTVYNYGFPQLVITYTLNSMDTILPVIHGINRNRLKTERPFTFSPLPQNENCLEN